MARSNASVLGLVLVAAAALGAKLPDCAFDWSVPSWDMRLSEPGAVKEWSGGAWCGHVQGMCVMSNVCCFSFRNQIVKTDWYGRLIDRVEVERYCGDICHWNGRLYTGVWCKPGSAKEKWCACICVYDAETLHPVKSRKIPWEWGAHGITCMDGVLYLGMGRYAPDATGCRNWYGKFDAETLEPIGEPFVIDHGEASLGGVQGLATDGTCIYASFYPPRDAPEARCMVVFDAAFNVVGRYAMNWQQGFDVVPGGAEGAVRFIHCTTANWTAFAEKPLKRVQVAVQFAEFKGGLFKDITRHCKFSTPLPR